MGYKIYEDCFRFTVRDRNDKYMFSTDTKEKANKIIKALKQIERVGEEASAPSCGVLVEKA